MLTRKPTNTEKNSYDLGSFGTDSNLKNFIAQSPVAMTLLTGPDFIIEIANEMALHLWGKRAEELIGRPALKAFPELIEQGFAPILESVYKGETYKADEMPITLIRNGTAETVYINFNYQPFRNSAGKIVGIMAVGNEVTELVSSRTKIQESEEKYKSLFESMNQGFCIIEVFFDESNKPLDYKFLDINKTFEKQTGLVNAKGRTARSLVPELEERWFTIYGNVALTGETARFTEQSEAMGKWFEVHAFRIGEDGSRKVAILFTDITDKKIAETNLRESERRFRDLADQSPIIIFIIEPNADATISYWSKRWLEYTGLSLKEALGRAWDGIVHPDDVPAVLDIYVPSFQARVSYEIPAIRLKRYDGVYRWHTFKGNPRFLNDGTFMGYVGVGLDIHEQKIAQEELQKFSERLEALVEYRTQELQRSNEDLQQFAHVASHDLKEPVRKIKTFANLLKGEFAQQLPERANNFVNRILSASERLRIMIDGVLTYSSLNGSEQAIKNVDLNKIIENVENDLEVLISQKKATIITKNLEPIEGAEVLLYQLFYNLINNAIKFSKPSVPPEINIKCEKVKHQGIDSLKIEVSDNGIGFADESSEAIFETFTRLHSKDVFEGTGLGLALCKKIVLRHSGTIAAKGEPDKGACFEIVLPVNQPKDHI